MKALEEIQQLCTRVLPGYVFETDKDSMKNRNNTPHIYFEEHTEGSYNQKFFFEKSTTVQLYFIRKAAAGHTAAQRSTLRDQIELEAVMPFMKAFNQEYKKVTEWRFLNPEPRFDTDDVTIVVEFNYNEALGN